MALWLLVGFALALFVGLEYSQRRQRRRLLSVFRSEWGQPLERKRDLDAIASYHRALRTEDERPLDERTGDDLDLDAVFVALDRTVCPVGQQVLYHRLRTTPTSVAIERFEALVNRLGEDAGVRERVQLALARLRGHTGDAWWLTQPGVLDIRRADLIFPFLAPVVPVSLVVSLIWPQALGVAVAGILINLTVRYLTADRLAPLLQPFRQVGPLIATGKTLGTVIPTASLGNGDVLASDLPKLARLGRIANLVSSDPLASGEYAAAVFEIFNMILLADVNVLYFASRELQVRRPELLRTIALVGTVDAAVSVASYRAGTTGWSRPHLQSGVGACRMIALRHPLLPEAVPNSIELAPPHGVLITGSNMSGKSTFLRTAGVNAVLAQTVNTCLAEEYRGPVLTVRSVIRRSDDLVAGRSYYRDEVDAVMALVHASSSASPHLFLFDELFRGTGTTERIAAAEATLAELVDTDRGEEDTPHIVIAATHDRELVDLMRDSYASYHFGDTIDAGGLSFDYRLREGSARSSNAIALLDACGAPRRLVQRALARTAALDNRGGLTPR